MKYLVTGSAGLIGSQITKDLVKSENEVYSCYNNLEPQFGIPTKLDLLNLNEISIVLNKIQPDIVIHLAAVTDVEKCEEHPDIANLVNAKATEIIAKESNNLGFFLIYVSTDYVFDGKKGLFNEKDFPYPINQYGKSKLKGEQAVSSHAQKWSIVRTSTPFQDKCAKQTFPTWLLENLQKKQQLRILDDQFTSPTYVPNLSEMIIELSKLKFKGLIHLSGASRISRFNFAKQLLNELNLDTSLITPVKIDSMNWKASRPLDSSLDVSTANSILSIKPLTIEDSFIDYIPKLKNSFSL